MIRTRNELKQTLLCEKKFYNCSLKNKIASFFGCCESAIIWKYIKFLRKWEYNLNCKNKIRTFYFHYKTTKLGIKIGFSIAPNCIDKGLYITHIGKILVNSNTKIGKNCLLNINTAFVTTSGNDEAPIVGDNCSIGVGAILIGKIKIGDFDVIGAGSVVTKSFGSNVVIAGVPAKIIKNA